MNDGLCENPDCGSFLDEPPTMHWDNDQKKYVQLCSECTRLLQEQPRQRYERVDPLGPMKGAC